jgi:hypothetical protein
LVLLHNTASTIKLRSIDLLASGRKHIESHTLAVPSDSESSDDELLLQPGSVLVVAHEGDPMSETLQQANIAAVQSAQAAVQSDHPRTYYEAMKRSDAHL